MSRHLGFRLKSPPSTLSAARSKGPIKIDGVGSIIHGDVNKFKGGVAIVQVIAVDDIFS